MSLMSKYGEYLYKLKVESIAAVVVGTEDCITNQRKAGLNRTETALMNHKLLVTVLVTQTTSSV